MAKRGKIDKRITIDYSARDRMFYFKTKNFKPSDNDSRRWRAVAGMLKAAAITIEHFLDENEGKK